MLWAIGVEGMTVSPLASSIIGGGVFVMGLVVAGTLSDYKDAERAPTDLAAGLYSILRETESMKRDLAPAGDEPDACPAHPGRHRASR